MELESVLSELQSRKEDLDNQRREAQFRLDKIEAEMNEILPKIQDIFGTRDLPALESKLAELESSARDALNKLRELENENNIN